MAQPHRLRSAPEGAFEPCTCEWQFRQLPPSRMADGVWPGSPWPVYAMLGWPAEEWHCWHNSGGRSFSKDGFVEPWELWQLLQFSATGGCSHRNGPRYCAWHESQVWLTVGLVSSAGNRESCGWWHDVQVISA